MRFLTTSLLACLACHSLWGQVGEIPQKQRFPNALLSDHKASTALDWWLQNEVFLSEIEWTHQSSLESPGGWHHRFQAEFWGRPLHGAELVLFVDHMNHLRGGQWANIPCLPACLPPLQADAGLWREGGWHWITWEDVQASHPRSWHRGARDVVSGMLLQEHDMLLHASDSVGRALVFRPDPLTKVGVAYGGIYIDDNDQNTAVLDPLRDTVSVGLTFANGAFTLSNSAAVIQEFDAPSVPIPNQGAPDFFFSRADPGFEMTHALYHIERIRQRLDTLGFGTLMTYAIPVDVNAFNGMDNSAFDRATNPPRLLFGEGGVDDAEDSDVIAHEYGHAISHAAAPFTVNGTERECLEEALCDYFAMSHSHRMNPWLFGHIFRWDGHNPFWGGRLAWCSKDYSTLTFTSIYAHTDVFTTPLGEGIISFGPEIMDRIVLESMYNYSSFMSMPQAAHWILLADSVLNGGQHASTLHLYFAARNILSPQISLPEQVPGHNSLLDRQMLRSEPWDFTEVAGVALAMDGRTVFRWSAGELVCGSGLPVGIYHIRREDGLAFRLLLYP